MAHIASNVGTFYRRGTDGRPTIVAPKFELMIELEETVDQRRFRPLIGLAMTPTLTRNEPGYDPDSRLFLAFDASDFPASETEPLS